MDYFELINEDIKKAMLAREKTKLEALRSIKKEFLEAKTAKGSDGNLSEEQAIRIMQKLVKQRKESAAIYQENQREELANNELAEAEVIEVYLPKALSIAELEPIIKEIITRVGASNMKDMGKVMGIASKELAGKADGRQINEIVRKMLSE